MGHETFANETLSMWILKLAIYNEVFKDNIYNWTDKNDWDLQSQVLLAN